MTLQLSMQISPKWQEVSHVRRRTAAFLGELRLPREVVDAVSMVACELTENATKYGDFEDAQANIDVRVACSKDEVTVEVTNPVPRVDDGNLGDLDRMVQWIRGFQDPFEAYVERLKDLSAQSLEDAQSRLGLVRIAYEGRALLDFYVNEHDVLAVSALRRIA